MIIAQRQMREQLESIWDEEETHNYQRINAHEYDQKETDMVISEEGAMEMAYNLMDNVMDSLYDALTQNKSLPEFVG
jgi:hypothetical protein